MRALLTAAFALAALVLTPPLATAVPPPADPPGLLTPTGPSDPEPCTVHSVPCDITLPTRTVTPDPPTTTTTDPATSTNSTPSDADTGTEAGTASGPATTAPADPAQPSVADWWVV